MYSKNCRLISVNEARTLMFTVGLRPLEFTPNNPACVAPAHEASIALHRFHLNNGLCPKHPTFKTQVNGTGNGMTETKHLPDASKVCSVLLHCGCLVACKGKSKCHRAGLYCGPLCKREGGCTNSASDYASEHTTISATWMVLLNIILHF